MSIKIDRKSGRIILANNETITFDQLLSECEDIVLVAEVRMIPSPIVLEDIVRIARKIQCIA